MYFPDLNITKLGKLNDLYKQRINDIEQTVESRWAKLLGYGRQYFQKFTFRDPYVYVLVANRYDDKFVDIIHRHYFEIPENKAIEDFKVADKSSPKQLNWNSATVWTPHCYLIDKEKIKNVNF